MPTSGELAVGGGAAAVSNAGVPDKAATHTSSSPSLRGCRICCEPIRSGAKKCIHCDSYQDWRRYLSLSNTVLALLVALVSVSTVALPELTKLVTPAYSSVSVEKRGIKGNHVEFIVNNSGTKEARVIGAMLRASFEDASREMQLEEFGPSLPIFARQSRSVPVFVPPYFVQEFMSWPAAKPGKLSIELRVQEYGGEVKTRSFEMDGREYLQFRAATQDAYDHFRGARRVGP